MHYSSRHILDYECSYSLVVFYAIYVVYKFMKCPIGTVYHKFCRHLSWLSHYEGGLNLFQQHLPVLVMKQVPTCVMIRLLTHVIVMRRKNAQMVKMKLRRSAIQVLYCFINTTERTEILTKCA